MELTKLGLEQRQKIGAPADVGLLMNRKKAKKNKRI